MLISTKANILGVEDDRVARMRGVWAGLSGEAGGFFSGHTTSDEVAWRGRVQGETTPTAGQGGAFLATWLRGEQGEVRPMEGVYEPLADTEGGRFIGVVRAQPDVEPTVHRLSIRNEIDGRSRMVIGTYYAWYHHDDYAAPGRHFYFGEGDPSSRSERATWLQGEEWYPEWPEDGENRWCDCESSVYESAPPHEVLVPYADAEITMEVIEGRGEVTILDYPSADNGYELTIE